MKTLKTLRVSYDETMVPDEMKEWNPNLNIIGTPKTTTAWVIFFFRKWKVMPDARDWWQGEYDEGEWLDGVLEREKELWQRIVISKETD